MKNVHKLSDRHQITSSSNSLGMISANLVSIVDDRMMAWLNSRPNIKTVDRKDPETAHNMVADFGINDQCRITMQMRTSVLFRELVASLRGTNMWAQTSRVNPIFETEVSSEYVDTQAHIDSELLILEANDDFKSGVPQDIARLKVPVTSSTCYLLGASLRTWVILCKILYQINTRISLMYLTIIWTEIQAALISVNATDYELELSNYKYDSKGLALNSLSVDVDDIVADNYSTSAHGITVAKFTTTIGMAAQLARHQHNQFRSAIWNYFMTDENSHAEYDLRSPVTVVVAMPHASYMTMLSHRSEWLADWGLWSSFVEAGTKHMTDDEFMELLDDPMNYIGDNRQRIERTDPNLPDPRILECPDLLRERITREGNTYISQRWLSLSRNGYIKDNKDNQYLKEYLSNFEE